jgi:hypothetical protein
LLKCTYKAKQDALVTELIECGGTSLTGCSGSRVLGDNMLVGFSLVTRCLGDNMVEMQLTFERNGLISKIDQYVDVYVIN